MKKIRNNFLLSYKKNEIDTVAENKIKPKCSQKLKISNIFLKKFWETCLNI